MNPIVSAGRHHNERPFTGRHQMSSRVLSRCFVRDTFNSPLALCLPAAETPAISFSRLFPALPVPFSLFPRCVRLVSLLGITSARRGKRERAHPYLLSVLPIERGKAGHAC